MHTALAEKNLEGEERKKAVWELMRKVAKNHKWSDIEKLPRSDKRCV